ncbi:MAG: glutathione S-transferase N-terminal domain-containing protein [Rhodanobacter sp.]
MYKLYYSPGTASMLVHLVLLESALPHVLELVDVDQGQQRSAQYLALNPRGLVPTLMVDGVPHTEAAAMTMLLAERHPERQLAPAPGSAQRADYLQWMFYLAHALQPFFRHWFYPTEHVADASDTVKVVARAGIEKCLAQIDAHLAAHGPYMLGEQFSVVDLYTLMLMRWSRNMPHPATDWPHLAEFITLMKTRPSWKRLNEIEGLTEWA